MKRMKTPKELLYTESHEWVKIEDGHAYLGITDFAQSELGEVVFVELPEESDEVNKGEEYATIESVKAASDINAPVSGVIVEVNENLEDNPELINEDPYENWIVKIELNDESETSDLLSAEDYEKLTK